MLPKIIHYCWLSDNPFPKNIQAYIESWKQHLPDYEIRKWDFNRFPRGKSKWVDDAFTNRKYAFAADYIRCYALYHEGGIYLDSDVEVLKPFDELLYLPYFFGFENGSGLIDAGILASEKDNQLFKIMCEYYDSREFIMPDGTFDTKPLPCILTEKWTEYRILNRIDTPQDFNDLEEMVNVLPYDYFSPIHQETRKLEQTNRTIAIHHFAASWQTGWPKYRRYLKKLLGPNLYRYFIKAKREVLKLFKKS